jgi:hypothetical protein
LDSYKKHPALTLQNQGYEKKNRDKLSDLDKAKIKEIEALLEISSDSVAFKTLN